MMSNSGFKKVLVQLQSERPLPCERSSRGPLKQEESENIKEGFRLYARFLVDVVDGTGRD